MEDSNKVRAARVFANVAEELLAQIETEIAFAKSDAWNRGRLEERERCAKIVDDQELGGVGEAILKRIREGL
jgi:hypothetical protein